jgi:hypothetical protein
MGTRAAAGFAIAFEEIFNFHDTGCSDAASRNRGCGSAEKSMLRIKIDDCTCTAVSR